MLEVRDLEVAYGAAPALWGVSLDVRRRRAASASSGPNGAGKTTLINAIAGLHRARGGRIVFDGRDITRAAAAPLLRAPASRSCPRAGACSPA